MKTRGPFPPLSLSGDAPALVTAFFELNQLKQLFRQGWLRRGVPEARCETVAEHIFSMAMLAWWLLDSTTEGSWKGLDRDRVLRMILVHELGEIYTGDIIPADNMAREEKLRQEHEAFWRVVGKLARGQEYMDLWEEFERGETGEARFVRQIDRLEMGFQAAVYASQGFEGMEEFAQSAGTALVDPEFLDVFSALRRSTWAAK